MVLQLAQFFVLEAGRQLRLARQDDREQFLGGCLEVGQQTHLLEQFVRQALCLVDDERGQPPSAVPFDDRLLEFR